MPTLSPLEQLLALADRALRTTAAPPLAERSCPTAPAGEGAPLSDRERSEAAALMRVNHVGEICAQALYEAQALATRSPELRASFQRSAREESDHLAWTQERIEQLGGRPSLLNPLWFGGSFLIGLAAARAGDRISLGFMEETERQVERHLERHLERLPAGDADSRAIVAQMRDDERKHADQAAQLGATVLPLPVRWAMRAAAKFMTTTAHYV
jgi:ubiquinone biosynthesis monooxygenase Coq7